MDAYPKACLLLAGGARVWGRIDGDVELSAGMTPNVVRLRVPYHELAAFGGSFAGNLTLELYWSDPDTADVVLAGWRIDAVSDSMRGTRVGELAAEVVEKTLTLVDRRWEFCDQRGGRVFEGIVNAATADGLGVTNFGNSFDGTTPAQDKLLVFLLSRLSYASGLEAMSDQSDELGMWGPWAEPRDVKWDGVGLAGEIGRMCDEMGLAWVLRRDGTYTLARIGDGELPSLPAGDALPSDPATLPVARSRYVVITSAPVQAIVQRVVGGLGWLYVCRDTDGEVKPVDACGFITAHYADATEAIRDDFAACTELERAIGRQQVYKRLMLGGDTRLAMLPMLSRIVQTDELPDSQAERPVEVEAKAARLVNGRWTNTSTLLPVTGWLLQSRTGTLVFRNPLGRVNPDGSGDLRRSFVPLSADDDLRVTFAHQAMPQAGPEDPNRYLDFFTEGYTLVGEEVVRLTEQTSPKLSEIMGPGSADVRVISMPELVELRVVDAAGETTSPNRAALQAIALGVARRMLVNPTASQTYRYRGLKPVDCNGNIASVRWRVAEGITEFDCRTWHVGGSRYLSRSLERENQTSARSSATASRAAPLAAQVGGRDYAQTPTASLGDPSDEVSGQMVLAGRTVAAWSPGETTIAVHPCDHSGNHVQDAVTVTLRIFAATGTPRHLAIGADDLVFYVPFGVADGILLPVANGLPQSADPGDVIRWKPSAGGGYWWEAEAPYVPPAP